MSTKKTYAAAVVWQTTEDEFDATEELIDALSASRQPIDNRFVGGAVRVPDTQDEYDSETVGPYITGAVKFSEIREAGEMSTSDGLGVSVRQTPREERSAERFEWLEERGYRGIAADMRDGIAISDLIREFSGKSDLVHQLATWIDEDTADPQPATPQVERHAAALRKLRKWIEDPDTDGDDATDVVIEVLREAEVIPAPTFITEGRKLRAGWSVKAPGAAEWTEIESVGFNPGAVVVTVRGGTLVYGYREGVEVKTI